MECIIYKRIKSATQSGLATTQKPWNLSIQKINLIEYESTLLFNSLDDAVCYAQKNKLNFKIIDTNDIKIKRRTYADNFTKKV